MSSEGCWEPSAEQHPRRDANAFSTGLPNQKNRRNGREVDCLCYKVRETVAEVDSIRDPQLQEGTAAQAQSARETSREGAQR